MRRVTLLGRALLLTSLLFVLSCARGCTSNRPPIHLNPNMDDQPKYEAQAESDFFHDGAAMQLPVEGVVARGERPPGDSFLTGKNRTGEYIQNPRVSSEELIARGRRQYNIYCEPCHGANADGQSMLAQRSGIEVANLLEARIREMPDGQLFETITEGFGLMAGYRYPIPPEDRWAIVSYVRDLAEADSE